MLIKRSQFKVLTLDYSWMLKVQANTKEPKSFNGVIMVDSINNTPFNQLMVNGSIWLELTVDWLCTLQVKFTPIILNNTADINSLDLLIIHNIKDTGLNAKIMENTSILKEEQKIKEENFAFGRKIMEQIKHLDLILLTETNDINI